MPPYLHHDLPVLLLLLERLLLVHQQVLLEVRILRVRLGAQRTGVGADAEVHHLVLLQVGPLRERLITALALERFFAYEIIEQKRLVIAAGAGRFCKLRETDEHQIELGSCGEAASERVRVKKATTLESDCFGRFFSLSSFQSE